MNKAARKRVRRSAEVAREEILQAAEQRLVLEGLSGVKVQRIAQDLGLTDAAIHYHFASRERLLEALLRRSGRRFLDELAATAPQSEQGGQVPAAVATKLAELFRSGETARLLAWLTLSGWKPEGEGMLGGLVDQLHCSQVSPNVSDRSQTRADAARMVAVMMAVAFTTAFMKDALMRSVGLDAEADVDLLQWLAARFADGGSRLDQA